MSFACGDSQEERFESARAVMVALQPKRRRPGETLPGFQLALARLPMRVLRAVIAGVRARLPEALARRWQAGGFVVLGCDGSRLECPRIPSLEARLGEAGKTDSAPSIWLTAIVHLATGVPWAWRFGKGTAITLFPRRQWYRWRWENEGYFRTYKRTLSMVKLTSRKVSLLPREAEGSMLAAQLLLATTAMELPSAQQPDAKASPRQALREFRREFRYLTPCRRREPLGRRLSRAVREYRADRTSPKATRVWPRRGPHKPPKPPKILTLDKLKKPLIPAFKRAA